LTRASIWSDEQQADYKASVVKDVLASLKQAEKEKKPPIIDLFNDVYKELPPHLQEQHKELQQHLGRNKDKYNLDIYQS